MAGNEAYVPLKERLWKRVHKVPNGCWVWTGHTSGGYGRIRVPGGRVQVHRLVYEIFVGTIADSLLLDHLCRNQRCCNPEHLEPVTPKDNTNRGDAPSSVAVRAGTCVRGLHQLTPENLLVRSNGKRECRPCSTESKRAWREANRGRVNAQKRALYAADPEPFKAAVRRRYAMTKAGV